jgi:adenylate cyclase class IV
MNPFDETAGHIDAAAKALRVAQAVPLIGWDESIGLARLADGLEKLAKGVRESNRKAILRSKALFLSRKDAARLLGSPLTLDGNINTALVTVKEESARKAAKTKREWTIENKRRKLLWEILEAIGSRRPLADIARDYKVREETLRMWARSYGKLLG